MPEPAVSRHATELPSAGSRAIVLAIALIFAVHSILVLVWVMPTNPIRDAIGKDLVEGYIDNGVMPFEQNWSVFAPVPRRAGENVQARAYFGETGVTTTWFDITADEDRRIRFLPNPSRVHTVTRRLGGDANELFADLTTTQDKLVMTDTPSRSDMARRLPKPYARLDVMLTRFATMYAIARWGDGVSMVQFRIGHRSVPAFAERDRVDFIDVPFSYQSIGWRKALRGDAAAQAAFDGYVDRASRKAGD